MRRLTQQHLINLAANLLLDYVGQPKEEVVEAPSEFPNLLEIPEVRALKRKKGAVP